MLFIHQQIQSFVHLGACKEYPTMARQKFPKKNGDAVVAGSGLPPSVDAAVKESVIVTETVKAKPRNGEARRPELIKSEGRGNLLPMNVEEEIRRLAYLLSERRGFEPGHETEDWLDAEREIQQRYHHHSA
jgi:hypothetical protein